MGDGSNEEIGGKVNRLKKAKAWTSIAVDTANSGLGLAEKGMALGGARRAPSKWIQFVKSYAATNGITYKSALSKAGPEYKKMKQVG